MAVIGHHAATTTAAAAAVGSSGSSVIKCTCLEALALPLRQQSGASSGLTLFQGGALGQHLHTNKSVLLLIKQSLETTSSGQMLLPNSSWVQEMSKVVLALDSSTAWQHCQQQQRALLQNRRSFRAHIPRSMTLNAVDHDELCIAASGENSEQQHQYCCCLTRHAVS
jgi:hypothetical protein